MTPRLLNKWIAALRSGKYQQTRRELRYTFPAGNKYCCLGVLCDVVDPLAWRRSGWKGTRNEELPTGLLSRDLCRGLVALNDERKASFSEIADCLERNRKMFLGDKP